MDTKKSPRTQDTRTCRRYSTMELLAIDEMDIYMARPERLKQKLRSKKALLDMLREDARFVSGVSYDKEPVSHSPSSGPIEGAVVRMTEVENDIRALADEMSALKVEIWNYLDAFEMDEVDARTVLEMWYFQRQKAETIAEHLGCTSRNVYELRKQGLLRLYEIRNCSVK